MNVTLSAPVSLVDVPVVLVSVLLPTEVPAVVPAVVPGAVVEGPGPAEEASLPLDSMPASSTVPTTGPHPNGKASASHRKALIHHEANINRRQNGRPVA
jgi:hypothetical protein